MDSQQLQEDQCGLSHQADHEVPEIEKDTIDWSHVGRYTHTMSHIARVALLTMAPGVPFSPAAPASPCTDTYPLVGEVVMESQILVPLMFLSLILELVMPVYKTVVWENVQNYIVKHEHRGLSMIISRTITTPSTRSV